MGMRRATPAKREGGHDRPQVGFANGEIDFGSALDGDALLAHGHWTPLGVPLVLVLVVRIGFEPEQIGLVRAQGGQSPRYALVESKQQAWTSRNANPASVQSLAGDVEFHPKRRISHGSLRVTHEDGRAGGGLLAANDPGMTELGAVFTRASLAFIEAVQHFEFADLPAPLGGHIVRLDDGRSVVFPRGTWPRRFRASGLGARSIAPRDELAGPVRGEKLSEMPPTQKAIGGCPGFDLDAKFSSNGWSLPADFLVGKER